MVSCLVGRGQSLGRGHDLPPARNCVVGVDEEHSKAAVHRVMMVSLHGLRSLLLYRRAVQGAPQKVLLPVALGACFRVTSDREAYLLAGRRWNLRSIVGHHRWV